ncbi:MAG: hypothetical protein GVY04_11415 [Cyanobacteria bacterium]|jgi:hypothetical protein|nr:hypothetical protein [Cyanobacteria bacterium GSL.Bin1]
MEAYKKYLTIEDPKQVILSDLPFSPGQRVEVIVIAEEDEPESLTDRCQKLFQETQAIHVLSPLTEEEVQAEIEAYRRGE